jgi:glycosyltransferase involved in cell wall biosynthesis
MLVSSAAQKRARIAFVANRDFRYQTTHPLDLAEVMVGRGMEVHFLSPFAPEVWEHQGRRGIKPHVLRSGHQRLPQVGECLARLAWLRPDLIIGYEQVGFSLAFLAARLLMTPKLIYYAPELSRLAEGERGLATRFQQRYARAADLVISTGPERAEIMRRDWGLRELPYVLPNTLVRPKPSQSEHRLRRRMRNYEEGDLVVFYPSSLSDETAVIELLRSVPMWGRGIKLALCGYGEERFIEEIHSVISQLGIGRQAEYLGCISQKEELFELLPGADLGLVFRNHRRSHSASVIYYTPGKLLEYAASGVPVLCSDNPSLLYVNDEGWGRVVDCNDPASIADGVNRLAADRAALRKMGDTAKRRFDEEYCMEVQGRRLIGHLADRGIIKCGKK